MTENLYPIFLKLEKEPCLVIGGGKVAFWKVKSLLESGAIVKVISPDLIDELFQLSKNKQILYLNRKYKKDDEDGNLIVIAATNDSVINQHIYNNCRSKNILVNCVDDPNNCQFYVPAVVRKGGMQMAFTSGGRFPIFVKRFRKKFESIIYPQMEQELNELALERKEILKNFEGEENRKNALEESLLPRIDKMLEKLFGK